MRSNHDPGYTAMDYNMPVVPTVRFTSSRGYGKTKAMAEGLTQEQIDLLRQWYTPEQMEQLREWAQRFVTGVNQAFEGIRDAMKGMGLALDPGEEYDTRERALEARRNRNTGPARPSAAAARRPRRHQ